MPPVTIFTTMFCPYCTGAKRLLENKKVPFEEIRIDGKPDERARMQALAGGKTSVPQIFIGDRHVGGCDELLALEDAGRLDPLLAV